MGSFVRFGIGASTTNKKATLRVAFFVARVRLPLP